MKINALFQNNIASINVEEKRFSFIAHKFSNIKTGMLVKVACW